MNSDNNIQIKLVDFTVGEENISLHTDTILQTALAEAREELEELNETIESLDQLLPQCDKLDYALAASSGALCGLIDIFLVGKPGDSRLGKMTDDWFDRRIIDFAKFCGWAEEKKKSPIKFLEEKFEVPYDQRGCGDAGKAVFNLTPSNHHFKSLAHNPTLLGLFFSILDQFQYSSHFISNGELVSLVKVESEFELKGHNFVTKCFCGFVNWFGHLMSDTVGSSGSKGRGMGIPSPFWSWTNDVIAIKAKLGIDTSQLNKAINELALNMYKKGFDLRYQVTQAIPVLINEMTVRFLYMVRRLFKYLKTTGPKARQWKLMWQACEPFSNASVKRMLTVAHGTFCALDLVDSTAHGFAKGSGSFDALEFCMRLNIVGVGRFTISLYGEAKRGIKVYKKQDEVKFAKSQKGITERYIEGLMELARLYDDRDLVNFVDDIKNTELYREAFQKSVGLAELRKVPEEKILKSKADIDAFFLRGKRKCSEK